MRHFCLLNDVGVRRLSSPAFSLQPGRKVVAAVAQKQQQATASPSSPPVINLPSHCIGCGVKLQQNDPAAPGFFQVPKRLLEQSSPRFDNAEVLEEEELLAHPELAASSSSPEAPDDAPPAPKRDSQMDLFDQIIDEWVPRKRTPLEIRQYGEQEEESEEAAIRCARCHSLQHNGRVKNEEAEAILPSFDFGKQVGRKIALTKFRKQMLVVVVDAVDFDGSLPTTTLKTILDFQLTRADSNPTTSRFSPDFSFLLVINKADLLPESLHRHHLEAWARQRLAAAGLPRPSTIAVVSSLRGWGVKDLLNRLQRGVGGRGDVWVVGTQNAGKSSLINAMRGAAGLGSRRDVTATHVPGTTLGALAVPGLLPAGCKLIDTPGMDQVHSLAKYLPANELKMLQPRRALKGRTFRISPGKSVLLGGLARIDVVSQERGATLYLTPWISDEVACYMGKTEGVAERRQKHLGKRLSPPTAKSGPTFPELVPTTLHLQGSEWIRSTRDVAIAGLGWVGVGVSGAAELTVWTPPGVKVSVREPLARSLAKDMERPGLGAALGEAMVEEKRVPRRTPAEKGPRKGQTMPAAKGQGGAV
ncbi:hypothetical protein ACKKBG_A03405 [Auxenochlorella protothecoides x Auxenochlorella symbiontica]